MSFPSEQLELTAQAAFGADLTASPETWSWTALTCPSPVNPAQTISRVLDNPITIKRGIAVGGSQQQTTSAAVNLLNLDGALTPELVTSPYWPYVDAGTPFRLRVRTNTAPYISDTFTRGAGTGWGVSSGGQTWVTTSPSVVQTTGTTGTMSLSTPGFTRIARVAVVAPDVDFTFDVSLNVVSTGIANVIGPMMRLSTSLADYLWPEFEFGLGGTVSCTLRHVVAGVTTGVAQVVQPGLTYTAGTVLRCRTLLIGSRIRLKAWLAAGTEPAGWTIDVDDTAVPGPGVWLGLQAWLITGNTNTPPVVFTVDNITATQPYFDRVQGYIADIQPRFLPQPDGSTWSTAVVTVGGVGILTEKREAPSESPMRRSIRCAPIPPIAYWALEDAEGSTFAASAYPGGPKMIVSGPAVFAFSQGTPTELYLSRYGTKPMVSVAAGARLSGVVPPTAVVSEWAVSFVGEFFVYDVPAVTEMRVLQWETPGGTHNRWALVAIEPGYQLRAYNDSVGTVTNVATYSTATFFGQLTYTIECHQNGANIDAELFFNDNSGATGSVAGTQARVAKVTVNPDAVNTTASVTPAGLKFVIGHVRVVDEISVFDTPHYTVPETGTGVSAIYGWYQEPAHRRLARLCDEEAVPFRFLGDPGTTGLTLLNAQQDGSFTTLTTAAAEAESGGLLFEAEFGYNYLPRTARYNQPVDLAIDMAAYKYAGGDDPGDILVPQLDSRAANYWTINRTNGASGSYAADPAYRKRRGTIAEERTLDVLTDTVLDDHAAWRTHINVDAVGANYPAVVIDLAANPELITDYLRCDIGSRVNRLNQPTIAGSGTIDQVIEGVTETIAPDSWQVTLAVSAGSVWDVGVYDAPTSVYSPTSTTLSSGITTTALSLTMAGEAWITGAVSLMFDIDGEHIAVSNISGSGTGPYTVTISARSVNGLVKAHLSGAAVTLANPTRYAL